MSNEKKEVTAKKDVRKQLGKVNFINLIAAVYVLYLAVQLLSALGSASGANLAMCGGGGLIFLLGGVWLLRREWKNFNRTDADEEMEGTAAVEEEKVADAAEEEEEYDVLPEEFMMPEGFLPPEGFVPPQTEEKNTETE